MDPTLRQRLVHFLHLKIEYGYYEFLSASYWPLTFQGLMNLVDFCKDEEIQTLALQAVRRIVADNLLFVNTKGFKYSAAGREYAERFMLDKPYSLVQDGILYVLTGQGPEPNIVNRASSFLTTSSIDFSDLVEAWEPFVDTTYEYGHTVVEGFEINSDLEKYDRIAFQFSAGKCVVISSSFNHAFRNDKALTCTAGFFESSIGAYFNPEVLADTVDFVAHYAIQIYTKSLIIEDFIKMVPVSLAPLAAEFIDDQLGGIGTDLSGATVKLYRNEGSMLSSVQHFWPGSVGHQAFLWIGVCDDVTVWTQSGPVKEAWLDKSGTITNTHLPSIKQVSNVALIMYKPKLPKYLLLKDVALYWPENRFDEVMTLPQPDNGFNLWKWFVGFITWVLEQLFGLSKPTGTWILGRKNDSYIAVYRPCADRTDQGWFACKGDSGKQTWVAVVGEATTHGTFENFAKIIERATVKEATRKSRVTEDFVYSASVSVDGKVVGLTW